MSERPPALDVMSVLDAAFSVRDEDPEYFAEWVSDVYRSKAGWHDNPDAEHWVHHASSLGQCERRYVLERAGNPRDDLTVNSRVTFAVGDIMHVLIQLGLAVHPDYTLLCHETGGVVERHGAKLAALCDAVYLDPNGQCCIIDIKSEKEWAQKGRIEDARKSGAAHTAKDAHALQVQATAAIIHRVTEYRPLWGWVIYFSKDSGRIDPQPIRLGSAPVVRRLEERELAWTQHALGGALPAPLDQFPKGGLCKPRSKTDQRGLYCPVREICKGAA